MVPVAGVEPAPCRQDWILSPARLPIPSHRHIQLFFEASRLVSRKSEDILEDIARNFGFPDFKNPYILRVSGIGTGEGQTDFEFLK